MELKLHAGIFPEKKSIYFIFKYLTAKKGELVGLQAINGVLWYTVLIDFTQIHVKWSIKLHTVCTF